MNLQGNSTGNSSFQPLQVFLMYILTLSHPVLYILFKATGGPLKKNFFSSCPENRGLLKLSKRDFTI